LKQKRLTRCWQAFLKVFILFRSKHKAAKQSICMVMAMDVLSVVHLFIVPQRKGFVLIIQRSYKNKAQIFISRYNLRTGVRQRMAVESPK
jgi:hypothetical protein